ncbi:MAG: DUF7666 domain-containing protein [Gammaproteobacteria bacterium]
MTETIKGYKFIQSDMASKSSDHKWKLRKWYKHVGQMNICESGFHATRTPYQSLQYIYGDIS